MINFSNIRSFISIVSITFLLMFCSFTQAHHGWSGYNADIDTTLVVTELNLGGSHDHLTAVDSNNKEWDLVLATPTRNRNLGFNEETLSVGDEIQLLGREHPAKPEIKVHCIYDGDKVVYTYFDWDGTTSLSKHSDREKC